MALDSSGNPQVEFVWGNMPLQGNTQRGVTAPVVKTTYNYQSDFFDGKGGMFAINLASATEVEAGWIITATAGAAGYTQITKEFTVDSVSMGSPGYYVRTKEAFDPAFQAAGQASPGAFATSIAPALNRGGGAGDKGWSKTTLVKSPLLDPTLDNHSLATSGWNGYPGYTPGISTPPLATLFDYTTEANNFGSTYWSVSRHQDTSGWYNGFNIMVTDPMGVGIEDLVEDWSALKAAIDNNTLSNAGITFDNWTSQYGTPNFNGVDGKLKVMGGWYFQDNYNNYVLTLSIVPTVPGDSFGLDDWYIFSGRIPVGVSIKITERPAAPALQFVQDDDYNQYGFNSGDAVSAFMNWSNYDGRLQMYVGNGITAEQATALTNGSLVGKSIGMGKLSQSTINNLGMIPANANASDVVVGVTGPFTDSYGATYYEIATDHGYSIMGLDAYRTGDTLVVL